MEVPETAAGSESQMVVEAHGVERTGDLSETINRMCEPHYFLMFVISDEASLR